MASQMAPNDFLDLTFPQLKHLLEASKKSEKKTETYDDVMRMTKEFRRRNFKTNYSQFLARYPNATDEDKREFYGIWPLS